ncbi:MAG TPA: hypothetical protein VHC00_07960 [Rhizobiaceae bacterium]|jgi:hypothetical protein|nr:hypothetical protein [Rhizobiaceae bacterium]
MDKQIKGERAKQGRWGVHILIVLVVGTILAIAVLWGAARYNHDTTPRQPGRTLQQGQ